MMSIARQNTAGARTQPCRTPDVVMNGLDIHGKPVMLFHHGVPAAGQLECLVDQLHKVPSTMQICQPSRKLPSGRYKLHSEASETSDGSLIIDKAPVLHPVWICS